VRVLLVILLLPSICLASDFASAPLLKLVVTSGFGMRIHPIKGGHRFHKGVDLASPVGTPIYSVASGIVVFAGGFGGYGNLIVIRHTDKLSTHFGHCKDFKVSVGDKVKRGAFIGTVGDTGAVTGPHLHFEVRYDGKPQSPDSAISLKN